MMPKRFDPHGPSRAQFDPSSATGVYAQDLPNDLSDLIRALQINSSDTRILQKLAEEAVARFSSDDDAVAWFEDAVMDRYPNLWWSIRRWLAQRSSGAH